MGLSEFHVGRFCLGLSEFDVGRFCLSLSEFYVGRFCLGLSEFDVGWFCLSLSELYVGFSRLVSLAPVRGGTSFLCPTATKKQKQRKRLQTPAFR